ncbi:H/ACA ribonucleoprotein complex non-core subunit NAF1 [Schistocerca serialis cubense]|uniref:H/ACA ribonucleoprotein complex non-core subunit NAF1 n=1 Tax=Schistocerca serialis cubense TaxID=2023355 RepID=UPI00214E6383|nr:H/ACA ribonucleoprotein complex non-core subunit NAF1 [Schistocerca serialis cubense]XP_049948824.1 H/ACA ribonucleoprotein complex non-core subunit NAF1 [Schistocerca serialis cubense]XP_049948826.1 H/ACA ribonucleoprotein complex non-core subunit NAF1 [Schistocerca serialis cubense]
MDCAIKLEQSSSSESTSVVPKSDEISLSSEPSTSLKETETTDDTNNLNEGQQATEKSETDACAQNANATNESNTESCTNNLNGDQNENSLTGKPVKSESSCSSNVICNIEADVLPVVDSKADYRSKCSLSEDSEDDSSSWEDEDSDSSTSNSDDSDSSSSSSSVSSSSLASGEDSDFDIFNTETTSKGPPRTRGELTLDDLPPIQNLHITVPKNECLEIGTITSIVEQLVVIQAYKDTPALDLDSVLFLKEGDLMLGHIFDVFGPVKEPCYCVRFNSPQHIIDHGVKVGMKVYCAPSRQEHSRFVFLTELLRQKGCDASWEHNNEPPPNVMEYSDDEEERKARRMAKEQRNQEKGEPDEKLNRKHQTYEQRMNARNLRMSEKHWNRPFKTQQPTTASISQASAAHHQIQRPGKFQGSVDGVRPGFQNNFRPWGPGPGQVKPQCKTWGNAHHHAPMQSPNIHLHLQSPNIQPHPSSFVRPPTFSMPKYMQSPPPPFVPFPTTLIQNSQNQQPIFDSSMPPPPVPQSPCNVDTGIRLFPEPSHMAQSNLGRCGSVPQGLHLTAASGVHHSSTRTPPTPPPLNRSESMPSVFPTLQPPNAFVRPDTTKPPPPVNSPLSYQFGSTTFGNPVAFSNTQACPTRPMYQTPPPVLSPWLLPPPPPPPPAAAAAEAVSQYPPQQIQQNQTNYSYGM